MKLSALILLAALPLSQPKAAEVIGTVTEVDPSYLLGNSLFCKIGISQDYLMFFKDLCPGYIVGDVLSFQYMDEVPVVCKMDDDKTCSFPSIFIKKIRPVPGHGKTSFSF